MSRSLARSVTSVVLVCTSLTVSAGAVDASKPSPRKFADCITLLRSHKNGIAATKKARGRTKATVNAARYEANKKLDIDNNGVACNAGDIAGRSAVGAGATAKKFSSKTFSGSGSEIVTLGLPAGMLAVATIAFEGDDGVTVATFDANETMIDVVASSYGSYSGTVLLARGTDADTQSDVATLDISGEGRWKVKVSAAAKAPYFAASAQGSGDAVYRYAGNDAELAVMHEGDDLFSVRVVDKDGFVIERTVDEYGQIDDVYPVSAGAYIVVTASAPWSLSKL